MSELNFKLVQMEHRPRYNQPFTLSEAILLDVSTISEEITRLQYSIKRLRETQETLKAVIDEAASAETADTEIVQAYQENKDVIGAQEERILILKLALVDKGASSGAHYDLDAKGAPPQDPNGEDLDELHPSEDHSGGLHL
ncbi:hypothetical protein F5878DRAFT_605042 [Lentinula raphanica]|uniref:Uncharacterized protein n=1 Tax=Lentinula raphanica TaxID=153919 RepID=A0AA38UJ99_9AGAR|nr:hypothetical protein F5878DRAFT_605042 [Lentinula raphanica]